LLYILPIFIVASLSACRSPETSGPAPSGDEQVSDVTVAVHPEIATILLVSWNQAQDVASARVEYSFEDDRWDATPSRPVLAGAHTEPLLGIPADTTVRVRVVEDADGEEQKTDGGWEGVTGSLPPGLPLPTTITWDADRSSPERWLLTTIDTGATHYAGPWWVYIMDRRGRVVWYRSLPAGRAVPMSRVSADGTHLTWGEVDWFGTSDPSTLERTTLDRSFHESADLPDMGFTYDELPDGSIAFDTWKGGSVDDTGRPFQIGIRTLAPDGTFSDLWNCRDWLEADLDPWYCGTNTVLWNPARGTFLWSLYSISTVIEIDPEKGAVASWGDHGADPIDEALKMQHYPNWTPEGTLLVHTQQADSERVQWAREFSWDEANDSLTQIWSYATSDHFAECSGEAVRLANGNTLLNYGCGKAIREVVPEGDVVWEVLTGGLVGHQTLLADLYALNRGPAGR
jgi:hypothetical protein